MKHKGLIIVGDISRPDPRFLCRVPTSQTEVCGTEFYEGQELAYQAHLKKCAARHEHVRYSLSLASRMPVFDPNSWDPEAEEHLAEVGKRMLKEGRMVLKKNERIET